MMLERIYGALKGAGLDARLATLHSGRLHGRPTACSMRGSPIMGAPSSRDMC